MRSRRSRARVALTIASLGIVGTVVGCAGGVGSTSQGGAGGGEGFALGADQSVVDDAVANLDEVTLTLQSYASGPDALMAESSLKLEESVEERSNGKIDIEIVWGQAVAAYSEVDDALADGRLDIAMTMPLYHPDQYPVHNAISQLSVYAPAGQVAGSAATYAMLSQLAWEDEDLVDEYESKGLTLLDPMVDTGQYGTWCTEPSTEADDLAGETISVSTAGNSHVMSALGGAPVFLEYVETFEALERNTVRCTMVNQPVAATSGVVEVAPHLVYSDSGSPSRTSGTLVAGSSFTGLPLPYQQMLFDAQADVFGAWLSHITTATAENYATAMSNGGSFEAFPEENQKVIDRSQDELVAQEVSEGRISDEQVEKAQKIGDEWLTRVIESGVPEDGELKDFVNWHDRSSVNFDEFSRTLYEEVYANHRPE